MSDENKVYNALSQSTFEIRLGGEKIELKPATLDNLQKMSAIASLLPILDEIDMSTEQNADVPQLVESFKYAKEIAEIICVTANVKSNLPLYLLRELDKIRKRRKIFRIAYKEASMLELLQAITKIMKESHVFFYQRCITTLKGMNHLKRTKETEPTALG